MPVPPVTAPIPNRGPNTAHFGYFTDASYGSQVPNQSPPGNPYTYVRDASISVVLLAEDYETTKGITGSKTGQKLFFESTFHPSPTLIQPLPDINDSWSIDVPELKVSNIRQGYLANRTNCGRTWLVSYETKGSENTISMDIASELVTYEVKGTAWKWDSDDKSVEGSPIFFQVRTANIKISRKIYNLTEFIKASLNAVGKCNNLLWRGTIPRWMVLYEGATINEITGENTINPGRIWEAELSFKFRSATDNYTLCQDGSTSVDGGEDGWNWIVRDSSDGTGSVFDKPKLNNGTFLYKETDFDILMTAGSLPTLGVDLSWMV